MGSIATRAIAVADAVIIIVSPRSGDGSPLWAQRGKIRRLSHSKLCVLTHIGRTEG
jgi:hypothetical protein